MVVDFSLLDRRTYPPSIIWCSQVSRTFVDIAVSNTIAQDIVLSLLHSAADSILSHISIYGDSLIPNGAFQWLGENGISVTTINTNNHQQTWGVLCAAIIAMEDFVHTLGDGVECVFTICDGVNEVGKGTINLLLQS